MKESIGSTASMNIVITFLAIVFAFLAATLSYYKAFKVNNIITHSIVKYEGYNSLSIAEINSKLQSIGYQRYSANCPANKKFNGLEFTLVPNQSVEGICIYFYNDTAHKQYQYGIVTYMTINLPIVSNFIKIPVNTTTSEIYGCYGNNESYGNDQIGITNCK